MNQTVQPELAHDLFWLGLNFLVADAASMAAMLFSSKTESEMWTFALLSNSLIVMRFPLCFFICAQVH
jgi:RsiW-degrading membrane proteinase PrsW (M82 family)